jgi:hypothetical protein
MSEKESREKLGGIYGDFIGTIRVFFRVSQGQIRGWIR